MDLLNCTSFGGRRAEPVDVGIVCGGGTDGCKGLSLGFVSGGFVGRLSFGGGGGFVGSCGGVVGGFFGAWGLFHHSKACLVDFHLDPVQKAWYPAAVVVYGHRPHQTTGPNGNVVGGICWRRTCRHKAAVGSSLYFTVPQHNFQVLGTAASCWESGPQYVASRRHGSSPSATVLVEVSRTALQPAV